ncbi:unnamed protein product [Ambrosiozyma monospora]|uniref:Unnamed protein product n=1 Tax=Ambrosiozyma monospora TaxID=43982 RepID=A0ACB5TJL5_AMBMO|nr:unnamed protein product [Ambrosiozyma monospora]
MLADDLPYDIVYIVWHMIVNDVLTTSQVIQLMGKNDTLDDILQTLPMSITMYPAMTDIPLGRTRKSWMVRFDKEPNFTLKRSDAYKLFKFMKNTEWRFKCCSVLPFSFFEKCDYVDELDHTSYLAAFIMKSKELRCYTFGNDHLSLLTNTRLPTTSLKIKDTLDVTPSTLGIPEAQEIVLSRENFALLSSSTINRTNDILRTQPQLKKLVIEYDKLCISAESDILYFCCQFLSLFETYPDVDVSFKFVNFSQTHLSEELLKFYEYLKPLYSHFQCFEMPLNSTFIGRLEGFTGLTHLSIHSSALEFSDMNGEFQLKSRSVKTLNVSSSSRHSILKLDLSEMSVLKKVSFDFCQIASSTFDSLPDTVRAITLDRSFVTGGLTLTKNLKVLEMRNLSTFKFKRKSRLFKGDAQAVDLHLHWKSPSLHMIHDLGKYLSRSKEQDKS